MSSLLKRFSRRYFYMRLTYFGLAAIILSQSIFGAMTVYAATTPLLTETFSGATTQAGQWIWGGSGGEGACLTAGSNTTGTSGTTSMQKCASLTDTANNGTLRLTSSEQVQAGFVILNQNIPADAGLDINFDMYQYGGSPYLNRNGDGISFFLIDGSANPTQPGAYGAGLGYANIAPTACPGDCVGLVGGYVGVGFDHFGNFSSNQVGVGGPGTWMDQSWQDHVVLRGNEASTYSYISGKAASDSLDNPTAINRDSALRRVRITISNQNIMNVWISYDNGASFTQEMSDIDLKNINGANSFPSSFKLGFAASTGAATNNHEIRNLSVNTLAPDLATTITLPPNYTSGSSITALVNVNNAPNAGPTTGSATVTTTIPDGFTPTSTSGNGWSCTISGQYVTCTNPSRVSPGASLPPISINLQASSTPPASITVSSTVTSADDTTTDNNTATATSQRVNPDLVVIPTMPETYQPNGTAHGTIDVHNQGNGPTVGPTTITTVVPDGFTPTRAAGDGWSCNITDQTVICTTDNVIQPNSSTPQVTIDFKSPADPPKSAIITTEVTTQGDLNTDNNSAAKTMRLRDSLANTGINQLQIILIAAIILGLSATIFTLNRLRNLRYRVRI